MSFASTVVAAAQAAVGEAFRVYDAAVPDPPSPKGWVVVYCDRGTRAKLSACGSGDTATVRWQVSCFGPTNDVADWLATRIIDYFDTHSIQPSGWTAGVVRSTFSQAATTDESVMEMPMCQAVDQFSALLSKL